MKRSLFPLLQAVLLVLACTLPAAAEMVSCAECGMPTDTASKFTSKIVQGDKTLFFCDIGDLFSHLKKTPALAAQAQVKDYPSGDWIDAKQAFYVHAEKKFHTPMGWGIASFRDKKTAAESGNALDFDGMVKALK